MYHATLTLTAALFLSGLIFSQTSLASENNSAVAIETTSLSPSETAQEREALRQLGVTLATGGETWPSFSGSTDDDRAGKYPTDFAIPDMDCSVDRIADYVSCYGSPIASEEEVQRRFTGLVDELEAVLPPIRWQGVEDEPRVGSTRSYTYRDQDSDAQIDIDIARHWSSDEKISYVVTIFGWTAFEPRL
jgi:hypothetical protein